MLRRCLLVWLLVCAGCSRSDPGESSLVECSDNMDNDGDHLNNCEDPGCQALEYCLRRLPIPTTSGEPLSDPRGAPMVTLPIEAGVPEDDGGVDPMSEEDAEVPLDAMVVMPPPDAGVQCEGKCTGTQQCTPEGECKDVAAPETVRFDVRILSAVVPPMDGLAMCFDYDCSPLVRYGFCICPPDPIVRLMRIRPLPDDPSMEQATELGRTSPVINETRPEWRDALFEGVELEPGDALRFEVYDADLTNAIFVFDCAPDLSRLREGPLDCEFPFFPRGEVHARVENLH